MFIGRGVQNYSSQITKNCNFHININFPACCSGPYSYHHRFIDVLRCETLDILYCEPIPAYVTSHQPTIPKGAKEELIFIPVPTKSKYP
ncbi:hypothetical protein Avbf_14280 [Armadillidium vulgare]|nr:hypothetical protein Avbf_14280 [Armadillidium vulgare]